MTNKNTSTKKPNLDVALQDLEAIVAEMERGDLPLEQALDKFEKGVKLARVCQKHLQQAELKVQKLTENGASNFAINVNDDNNE